MADVTVDIGGHSYTIACRDGEEAHLLGIAGIVNKKAAEAREAVGGVNEVRQLLFASLLLADELSETREVGGAATTSAPPTATAQSNPATLDAIERIATRMEALASQLEGRG